MSPLNELPQRPADNAAAAGFRDRSGRASHGQSGFDEVMADVATPSDESAKADVPRGAKASGQHGNAVAGSPSLPPGRLARVDNLATRSRERAVAGNFGEAQEKARKAERQAAATDGADDKVQAVGTGAATAGVQVAPVLQLPATDPIVANMKKGAQDRTPHRPVGAAPAEGEGQADAAKAASLRVPDPQMVAEGTSGDIALRVVGSATVGRTDATTPRTTPASGKAATPARVITANVVKTETHLAAPTGPAVHEPAEPQSDSSPEDEDRGVDPRDAGNRRVQTGAPAKHVAASEVRRHASDADSDAGRPSPNSSGRAGPGPVASGAPTPAPNAAPGAPLSTTLANSVVAALKSTAPAAPATAAAPTPPGTPSAVPVQAMTVRLDLPEHGRIDVRMAARGSEVSLHLTAEREDTVRKLAHEHDAVVASLRDAGYTADIRTTTATHRDAGAQPQSAPNGGSESGQPGADGSSSQSRHADRDDRDSRSPQREPHASQSPDGDRRTGGGIYV